MKSEMELIPGEREAFEERVRLEAGPSASDLWIKGNPGPGYANDRVNDYRSGWVYCLEWQAARQQVVPVVDRKDIIDVLMSATGMPARVTADAILGLFAATPQPSPPDVNDTDVVELNNPAPQPSEGVEELDQRMLNHFTCTRVDNAGGVPDFTLYMTKMGAHHTYQLYRNEALALHHNLGRALGVEAPPAPDVSGLKRDAARYRWLSAQYWFDDAIEAYGGIATEDLDASIKAHQNREG